MKIYASGERQVVQKSLKINAGLNVIKQLCQVIFPLISIPYITRVLQPENYGRINYAYSIVSYFVLLAGLGISTYSVREGVEYREDQKRFSKFASEIFSINLFSTLCAYLLLMVVLLLPSMEPYRKLIAIQSIVIILTTIGTDWINTIYEDYAYITVRYIVFQILSIILMFALVHKPGDYLMYAAIVVGSSAGANVLNFFHVRKYASIRFTLRIDWRRHFPPIVLFFANILAITVYVNSDITMLGIIKGDTEVGIYTLASKIYSIVKQVLNAIIVVTVPRLSFFIKREMEEAFRTTALRIQKVLIMFLIPATVGVACLSQEIVGIAGGSSYLQSASTLGILSGAIVFSLLATYYTCCIMIPLGMEKHVLTATVISALLNVGLNFIFIPTLSCYGAAITTVISEGVVCSIGAYYSMKRGKLKVEKGFLAKTLVGSCFVALACALVRGVVAGVFARIVFSVIISAVVYLFVGVLIRNGFLVDEVRAFAANIVSRIRRGEK